MAELWPFNEIQDGRRRHLGFLTYVNFDGKSGCTTPFLVYVSNLVKIYATRYMFNRPRTLSNASYDCIMCILTLNLAAGQRLQSLYQILCKHRAKMAELWQKFVIFNMVGSTF